MKRIVTHQWTVPVGPHEVTLLFTSPEGAVVTPEDIDALSEAVDLFRNAVRRAQQIKTQALADYAEGKALDTLEQKEARL